MQSLEELSIHFGGKIKRQQSLNMNFKEESLKRLVVNDYKNNKIQIEDFVSFYLVWIKVNSDLSFSVNKTDQTFSFDKVVHLTDIPYKVYAASAGYNPFEDKYFGLFWDAFSKMIVDLKLSANEGFFFYNNYVCFALNFDRDLALVVSHVIDLLNKFSSIFSKNVADVLLGKNIPENLRPLLPLLKGLGISDDVERELVIEELTDEQRIKFGAYC